MSVIWPNQPSGSPSSSSTQASVRCSSSVAAGDVRHSIAFTLRAEAISSPTIPGPRAADPEVGEEAGMVPVGDARAGSACRGRRSPLPAARPAPARAREALPAAHRARPAPPPGARRPSPGTPTPTRSLDQRAAQLGGAWPATTVTGYAGSDPQRLPPWRPRSADQRQGVGCGSGGTPGPPFGPFPQLGGSTLRRFRDHDQQADAWDVHRDHRAEHDGVAHGVSLHARGQSAASKAPNASSRRSSTVSSSASVMISGGASSTASIIRFRTGVGHE